MPEREADRRKQRLQELRVQLDQWESELRDQDWIERLLVNEDVAKLVKLYTEASKAHDESLVELSKELVSRPLSSEAILVLKQKAMVLQAYKTTREDIFSFPEREKKRLDDVRKQYPKLQDEYKKLRKQEEQHG